AEPIHEFLGLFAVDPRPVPKVTLLVEQQPTERLADPMHRLLRARPRKLARHRQREPVRQTRPGELAAALFVGGHGDQEMRNVEVLPELALDLDHGAHDIPEPFERYIPAPAA